MESKIFDHEGVKFFCDLSTDRKKIIEYGNYIINMLDDDKCNVEFMNHIFQIYLDLLKEYDFDYFQIFMGQGYKKIDEFIANDIMLTRNMMMFDCYITCILLDIKSFSYMDFYEEQSLKSYAFYKSEKINVNMSAVREMYENLLDRKDAPQCLLFILSHELIHASQTDYRKDKKQINDDFERLRMLNCSTSFWLAELDEELYSQFDFCFSGEYDANIRAIEILYSKYKLLPSIKEQDKEKMNMILASDLFNFYANVDGYLNVKISPVNFTRIYFSMLEEIDQDEWLDDITGFSSGLENTENNLTDYERFLLGYDNPYLELLEMIANGKLVSTNLFEDLPIFYEKYSSCLEKKYIFYNGYDETKETYRNK